MANAGFAIQPDGGLMGNFYISCDAPPYWVVQGMNKCPDDFKNPEDVKWCNIRNMKTPPFCSCGFNVDTLNKITLTLVDKEVVIYAKQCPKCRIIYWKGE